MTDKTDNPNLYTLGDSHSLWNFAGIGGAKIFWRGPVTMHRAARDGIKSLIPKNCKPSVGDILILSFGDIDCRAHIAKQAFERGTTTEEQVDILCDRFEFALRKFSRRCKAKIVLSCILPPTKIGLPLDYYPNPENCIEDAKKIRERMNKRLSEMAPLIDFRAFFTSADGELRYEVSDQSVHIDSRCAQPVADALNMTLGTSYSIITPTWPNPKPMVYPGYISPIKRIRRKIKALVFASFRAAFGSSRFGTHGSQAKDQAITER